MSTWTEIKELRLKVCDPQGFINLEAVANEAARPPVPAAQTAYLVQDRGEYQAYDAELMDWKRLDLELSDARIGALVDAHGAARATAAAVTLILAAIGRRLGIARSQGGAESVEFQTLDALYAFYKNLARAYGEAADEGEGTSTGRYLKMRTPHVAGGMR